MDTQETWYSEKNATFGDRLAAAREAAEMTQKDLAKRVGVKLATLRNWEDDIAEPRANRLSTLSGLLGVTLRWLLTGEGEGVDPPGEAAEIPEDMTAVLAEIRALHTQARQTAEKLAVLEKRLRGAIARLEP